MTITDHARIAEPKTYPLGKTRPPLDLEDLPEPEEVFQVKHIGPKEAITRVIGPSLIALGISIGSGEWLLAPLGVAGYGFVGIGWVILISAVLQTFYNMEIGRYIMATGEVPILGWARVAPGVVFWVVVSLGVLYMANIWGGWAAGAGESLYVLLTGSLVDTPGERTTARILAFGLMLLVLAITLVGRKISRTLELVNWGMVGFIVVTLLIVDLFVVPFSTWWIALKGLVTPSLPPSGVDATVIGGIVGYTALASGLNWYAMNYYRDKGYGMGHRVGFIAGLVGGEQREIAYYGKTFPDTPENARRWQRWFRLLMLDQWVVFFGGAIIGIFLTTLLISHLAGMPGEVAPTRETMPTYAADVLSRHYGSFLYYWALLVGFFILFSTQIGIFEALVRNVADGLYGTSARFRELLAGDPRRFYYPYMALLAVVIGIILFQALPVRLVLISANMSNLGALIFPFLLMYLNRRLPGPARIRWWSYLILVLNVLFFGFFFINFAFQQVTGEPIVSF
ncbi:MAG: Nramp family divalent metal transporter [Sphaerobacter sp.]|nr:Nramp family divalent metal transporter [Sphaerobacter sp.]